MMKPFILAKMQLKKYNYINKPANIFLLGRTEIERKEGRKKILH